MVGDVTFTDPNCQYTQRAEFLSNGNLKLNLQNMRVLVSVFNAEKELYFEHKPTLRISSVDCAKTIEVGCVFIEPPSYIKEHYRITKMSNFVDIMKGRGVQTYRQIRTLL